MIQDILTVKIERNIYVNEEKTVSEIQIFINKTFLLFSHQELLMSFIMYFVNSDVGVVLHFRKPQSITSLCATAYPRRCRQRILKFRHQKSRILGLQSDDFPYPAS